MPASETQQPNGRRLVRTRRGRLIGGVCSGLGSYFGVDPILVRLVFVALAIFAGIGIWLYVAIVLLVPEEGASRPPILLRRSSLPVILGVGALLVGVGIGLAELARTAFGTSWRFGAVPAAVAVVGFVAALTSVRLRSRVRDQDRPSADLRMAANFALVVAVVAAAALLAAAGAWLGGVQPAAAAWAVVVVGVALALSAFTRARWLVLPAIVFALAVATVAAAHVDFHGGVGERVYRPRTLRELRASYGLGAGRLEVDLRGIAFPAGDTTLHVGLGAGELVVLVPDELCVATHARVGAGFAGALDGQSGGLDVAWANRPSPPPSTPTLVLEGRVGMGALFVLDRPLSSGFQPGLYGADEACRLRAPEAR